MTPREIREFRARYMLTQDQFGAILGWKPCGATRQAVRKLEVGQRTLREQAVERLRAFERENDVPYAVGSSRTFRNADNRFGGMTSRVCGSIGSR